MVRWRKLALGIVLVSGWLLFTGASMVGNPHDSTDRAAVRRPVAAGPPAGAAQPSDAVTVHLGRGRASAAVAIHRPAGEIILYRIRAPDGTRVRATTQIPGVTTRLAITTGAPSAAGECHAAGGLITCATGEEGCPMPEATWQVDVRKLAGPPGDVTIWFRVGQPPALRAA